MIEVLSTWKLCILLALGAMSHMWGLCIHNSYDSGLTEPGM